MKLKHLYSQATSKYHRELSHLELVQLEQPEQDPFCYHDGRNIVGKEYADHSDVFPLYAESPLCRSLETRQEPVAWMVMNGICNYQLFWSKHQADALCAEMQKRHDLSGSLAAFRVVPLYKHPTNASESKN